MILIILLIVFTPIIRKKITASQVKNKFLATIYEINRNGNFHIIERERTKSPGFESECFLEEFAKDGEIYNISRYSNGSEIIIYAGLTELVHMAKSEEQVYGSIFPNFVMPMHNLSADLVGELFTNCKFDNVEKGIYKGKDCYVIEVSWEKNEYAYDKYKVYVNDETYLPYGAEYYSGDNFFEVEFEMIEIGTVEEIPMQYDLEFLKSKSQKQFISNGQ